MISEERLKHLLEVGRKCRKIARQIGMNQEQQDACFIMGLLHDIGYENCDSESSSHHEKGVELLTNFQIRQEDCMDAIRNHGFKHQNLTAYDYVLNLADLTVDDEGKDISIEERLETIRGRYGEDSDNYRNAVSMSQVVQTYIK